MVTPMVMPMARGKPHQAFSIPLTRFIPKRLATSVGNIMSNVMLVSIFMTLLMLLLMMLNMMLMLIMNIILMVFHTQLAMKSYLTILLIEYGYMK